MFTFDSPTKQAITHTRHCLVGCGIGEILGSIIGAAAGWANIWQTTLAITLAFTFGYGLTYMGGIRSGLMNREARQLALRTDTVSIISMEIIDNALEWLIPGAMNAVVLSWLFWWSLAVSLAVAFLLTVPVNRFMLIRFGHSHSHSHSHHH